MEAVLPLRARRTPRSPSWRSRFGRRITSRSKGGAGSFRPCCANQRRSRNREGLMQMQEEARKSSLTEALAKSAAHEDHPTTDLERFFRTLKQMTVNGYYTSAIGIHQDLQYQGNTYLSAFPPCALNPIGPNQALEQGEKTRQAPRSRAPRGLSDEHRKQID